jgi:hypothetical protein
MKLVKKMDGSVRGIYMQASCPSTHVSHGPGHRVGDSLTGNKLSSDLYLLFAGFEIYFFVGKRKSSFYLCSVHFVSFHHQPVKDYFFLFVIHLYIFIYLYFPVRNIFFCWKA